MGGAPLSPHRNFTALDISFNGVSPKQVYDRLREWRRKGKFVGGVGIYPSAGFDHIDTRGTNATWSGR